MALVRSRDTNPEMQVRRFLHAAGLRYVLHPKNVPGSPDLAFPARKVAVFVHGCFWHRHEGCARCRTPKTRVEFWEQKFADNVARDRRVQAALESEGWKSMTIWECDVESQDRLSRLARRIRAVHAKAPSARKSRKHD